MQEKKKLCKLDTALFLGFLIIYAGLLTYLYYNQLIHEGMGPFESDTSVHYRMGAEEHFFYSFSSYMYFLFSYLPFAKQFTAFFLAMVSALTVYLTKLLVIKVCTINRTVLSDRTINILSVCLNFAMPFYVKAAHYKHYIGYQSGNMWHNSTYTLMRVFAILTIMVFVNVYETYREKLSAREWFLISGCLMIASGIKSSFLTVFAPLLAILLLTDLIKGTKFSKLVIMGCTIIPSMAVIVWQSLVIFEGSSSGVAIAPFKVLSERSSNPKITVVLSVLFPLLVLAFHICDFYKDKLYFGSLIMWGVGFTWVFFLTETGERSVDGNFMWGYSISLFFWFIASAIKVLCDLKDEKLSKKNKYLRLGILGPVFAWHVICGVWYLILLLQGNTYFI